MFSPHPTPTARPSSLNAASTWKLGHKRLLYLILLGEAMVGSGGFKREGPSCCKIAKQPGRAEFLAVATAIKCPVSFLAPSIGMTKKNGLFFRLSLMGHMILKHPWSGLFPHLYRGEGSDGLQGFLHLYSSLCVAIKVWETVGPAQISSYEECHPKHRNTKGDPPQRWKHQLSLLSEIASYKGQWEEEKEKERAWYLFFKGDSKVQSGQVSHHHDGEKKLPVQLVTNAEELRLLSQILILLYHPSPRLAWG